jgi:NADH-quinone oxidoreductase subunit D
VEVSVDPIYQQFRDDPHLPLDRYDPAADIMPMNMGPQHPSTHGVMRLKLFLDGETVVKAVPYPGYLHRGVEKLCEHRSYVQLTPIFDKHDYLAPMHNEQALVRVQEEMLGIEPPPRAQWLRCLLAELNRVGSHLLWLATYTLDLGGVMGGGACVMMYTFREREQLFDIFEALTGSRFHYNTHTLGGQRHDPPAGWDRKVLAYLDEQERRLLQYQAEVETDIFELRSMHTGVISPELALGLGLSGPALRASGVDHDLRRDAPYWAYDQVQLRVPVETAGDCLARYRVRFEEMKESLRLARAFLEGLPEGPIGAAKPVKMSGAVKIPGGRHYAAVESPRGELGTYLVAGGGTRGDAPYRLKIRPPSLHAMSALPWILPGHTVSDVVAILGSLDPILGEVDR